MTSDDLKKLSVEARDAILAALLAEKNPLGCAVVIGISDGTSWRYDYGGNPMAVQGLIRRMDVGFRDDTPGDKGGASSN